ncbi:MAG: polysaccharide biosynthesis protein, partial [Clostridia bacterium]
GDLFIRKAPACSMERLGIAVANLLRDAGLISVPFAAEVIGVRHGEKIHETLATSAELTRAEDMGQYWRVRPDARDLNYAKYFTEGTAKTREDFTSENATQLTVEEIKKVIPAMPEINVSMENA